MDLGQFTARVDRRIDLDQLTRFAQVLNYLPRAAIPHELSQTSLQEGDFQQGHTSGRVRDATFHDSGNCVRQWQGNSLDQFCAFQLRGFKGQPFRQK